MFSAVKHVLSEAAQGAMYLVGGDTAAEEAPQTTQTEVKPYQPDVAPPSPKTIEAHAPSAPPAEIAVATPVETPVAPPVAPPTAPPATPVPAAAPPTPTPEPDDFALSKWTK